MTLAIPMADQDAAKYAESVISYNVKMLLSVRGKTMTSLAESLGIKRSAMSLKMSGRNSWSVADLINASKFLDTKPEALMDDSLMRQQTEMLKKIGISTVRYLLMPDPYCYCAPARIRTEDPRLKRTLL